MIAMHSAILALSLAFLVPQTIAQSISFLPPSSPPSNITFPQATHYDLYKNSKFTADCAFPFTPDTNDNDSYTDYVSEVQMTFARSQAGFCAKLNPKVPWFVWPTRPTSAAYLPNWLAVLASLIVLSGKWIWRIYKHKKGMRGPLFDKWDMLLLVYDVGQFGVWWYCTMSGFTEPLHANWVDPIQWLTPISYIFLILADPRPESDTRLWIRRVAVLVCIALAAADSITGLTYISQRLTDNLSAGSYIPLDPFPDLPEDTTSSCLDLLQDPASLIYSDPNWYPVSLIQVIVAGLAAFLPCAWAPVMVVARCFNINVKLITALVTYTYGILVQFAVLIWLIRIATRGVPLMLHEGCGIVVIAMSPARGYYDSKLYYDGLKLQVTREAFGICKSPFVQTEYPSQAKRTS